MSERPTLASVTAIGLEQATLPFVSDAPGRIRRRNDTG